MKTDDGFLADLHRSHASVKDGERLLAQLGYKVMPPDLTVHPLAREGVAFCDDGDLIVEKRFEVKHRKINFTCGEDYPFNTVFIDECYKIDRRPIATLEGYLIVNAARTRAAVITATSRRFWATEKKYDAMQGRVCDIYAIPTECVARWVDINHG